MKKFRRNLAAVSLPLVLAGCGYALVGRASNIPEDIQAVYLDALLNRTSRGQIEQFLTQSIANELVTRRRFDLVRSRSDADAVLRGSVMEFRVRPVSFDRDGRADEYEITIVADMIFERFPSEEVLWSAARYVFRENYEVENSSASFIDQENIAIEETANRFAQTMVSDLFEGF